MIDYKKAYHKMRGIAGEAIGLADSYAGGDSENAKGLNTQFETLELKIDKQEQLEVESRPAPLNKAQPKDRQIKKPLTIKTANDIIAFMEWGESIWTTRNKDVELLMRAARAKRAAGPIVEYIPNKGVHPITGDDVWVFTRIS